MRKLLFYFFIVLFGNVALHAEECTELFPGKNLHPDWQITDINKFTHAWGAEATIDEETVYCETTSGKLGSIGGGGYVGSLDVQIELKPSTSYLVRARIYVNKGTFQIGGLGYGDIVRSTKEQEWELVEGYFTTGASCTGLYFNNCCNGGGDVGYIDNWELYEWPNMTLIDQLKTLCEKGNSLYDPQKTGAEALKGEVEKGEALLLTISNENIPESEAALEEAIGMIMVALAEYLEPWVSSAMDYTFAIKNPTFETSYYGWESTTGASNNQLQTNNDKSKPDGTGKFWENWNPDLFSGTMSQYIYGLPNGSYTLKAAAFRDNNTEDVYLYAADDAAVEMTRVTSGTLTYHTVNFFVTNNAVEIGLNIENPTANWVAIDNVSLIYRGNAMNALIGLLEEAELSALQPMEAAVATALAAAITEAKNVIQTQSMADVAATIELLDTAHEAAEKAIAIYAPLKTMIDKCNANKATYASYSGYAELIAVLEPIEQKCTAGTYAADDIQEAMNTLRTAEIACRINNPNTPADFTFAIWNPSFEEGQGENLLLGGGMLHEPVFWFTENTFDGWIDVKVIDNTGADVPHEGNHIYNVWAGTVNFFNVSQEIDLPVGSYTLTAAMRTGGPESIINQYIYASIDDVSYSSDLLTFNADADWKSFEGWIPLSVDFKLTAPSTVKIGAESYGGWFQLDDFQLTRTANGTGINVVNQDKGFSAIGISKGILVKSDVATRVNVYSIIGQSIKSVTIADGETTIPIAPGVYIVNGVKVSVK